MGDPESNVKPFSRLERVMDPMMEAVQSTETGPVQDRYQLAVVHLRKEYAAYVFKKAEVRDYEHYDLGKVDEDSEVFAAGRART